MPRESEAISYLMLFCALVVARKNRATWGEAARIVPLTGNAGLLAYAMSEDVGTTA